ncbi:hypothetical protein BJX65DRAFT_266991 [Aspergillus insuetus]
MLPLPVGHRRLSFIGRILSDVIALAADTLYSKFLLYPSITFISTPSATLVLEFTLITNTNPDVPITYNIHLGDGPITTY